MMQINTALSNCLFALGVLMALGANAQDVKLQQAATFDTYTAETSSEDGRTIHQRLQTVMPDTFYNYDFSDSLAGWTFSTTNPADTLLWRWQDSPDLSFNGGFLTSEFGSPTAANGLAFFPATEYIFDITDGAPTQPYPVLIQSLISPTIDVSAAPAGAPMAITFFSYYRALNDKNNVVEFSAPGIATASVPFGQAIPNNEFETGDVLLAIPAEFAGTSELTVTFVYNAGFYGWAVDDIRITSLPAASVSIDGNFFAAAPNYSTPITQLDSLVFVTDLTNEGGQAQDVKLAFTVTNSMDEVVATDTLDYGTVNPGDFRENEPLPRKMPMPEELGLYTVTYEIVYANSADEATPGDNSLSYQFEITEDVFSKNPEFAFTTRSARGPNLQIGSGAIYYVPNDADSVMITQIGFAVGYDSLQDNDTAPTCEVLTYGWFGDLNGDGLIDDDEIEELSLLEYNLTGTDFPVSDSAYIVAPNENGDPVQLSSDYIGFIVEEKLFPALTGSGRDNDDLFIGVGRTTGYGAYELASDSIGAPRYAAVLELETDRFYGYFGSVSPWNPAMIEVRMSSSSREVLPASAFEVTPNPAVDFMVVNFEFDQSERVVFKLIDPTGRAIRSYPQQAAAKGQFSVTTDGLPNGIYAVRATTDSGKVGVKQVVIMR